jgi:hypothetical protein
MYSLSFYFYPIQSADHIPPHIIIEAALEKNPVTYSRNHGDLRARKIDIINTGLWESNPRTPRDRA